MFNVRKKYSCTHRIVAMMQLQPHAVNHSRNNLRQPLHMLAKQNIELLLRAEHIRKSELFVM